MTSVPAVVIEQLVVRRGGREVLHSISSEVQSGTVTGLIGPSGCGKTTLMRAIVGVQIVQSGQVSVLGIPAGSAELRRRVGYLTQAPSIYADLTVHENLSYFAQVLGVGERRIGEVIESVSLTAHANQVASDLSGGERSRVSLASALLGEPHVLVLDEPTVGLDPVLRRDLWNHFVRIARSGATLLISSHVMDEAEHCDELLLMRDGELLATASPDELRERTGAHDLEKAFLALIDQRDRA